ncbi:tudor domain-containing protein 7B-like [Ceratina calcarata]|uniref:Tudor domain-containing protein 7B-like n=1 Tax=Ceratina calcarata TaxID=156304 RepID=A0AAJ7S3V2_9HYME|nr:tudor domain-containing protein 7B-like [Ceratina calcarata]XP_026670933.1 tudor domain-containing protein 7B-like [Ceratina calcarata]
MSNPRLNPNIIPALKLPRYKNWAVSVNFVVSTTEIWARVVNEINIIDPFYKMMEEMNDFYNNRDLVPLRASRINFGHYYAVYEHETWHRTRCKSIDVETGNITLFFIDHGSTDIHHCTELYTLERKFYTLPAQALRLRLFGLEYAHDYYALVRRIDKLLYDRPLFVKVVRFDRDEKGPILTVVFYDTYGREDVNLNDYFTDYILSVARGPALDTCGKIYEVIISYVDTNGDVYVEIKTKKMKFVYYLLNRLIPKINENTREICPITTVQSSKIYLVWVHNNWYRAKILCFTYHNQLKVLLIDIGHTVLTVKSNLLNLEQLCEPLAKCPGQVKKVHIVNINKLFVKRVVNRLVPKGLPILMKIDSFKENVPYVKLFRQMHLSDMLVPIIDNLSSCRYEIPFMQRERMMEDDEIIRSLNPPRLPDMHVYFEVHVVKALNPDDFTIQPFAYRRALHEFMNRLRDVCEEYEGPPLTRVKKGQIYAARLTDGHWYRVRMLSVIRPYLIGVYFCDYGDETVLPLSKLQPLHSEFLEFPYQAMKAKCAGIRPINGDWTPDDILRFKDLVAGRNFGSVIVSRPDVISNDTILGLQLIDANKRSGSRIDKILVDEGRAVYFIE